MSPTISIIVPVYNAEHYIQKCIDSILSQTFSDFELILVDDGSPDNSGEICKLYSETDKRIKIITKMNGGVSSARNVGIDCSKGQYVIFCDSDDYLENNCFSRILEAQQNVNCDLLIYGYYQVSHNERRYFNMIEGLILKEDFLFRFDEFSNPVYINSPVNKLYHNSIIKKCDIRFSESKRIGEDLLFNLAYLTHIKNIYVLNTPLYNYITDNVYSSMHNYWDNFNDIQSNLMKELISFFQKHNMGIEVLRNCLFTNFIYTLNYYSKANIPRKLKKVKIKETLERNGRPISFDSMISGNIYKKIRRFILKTAVKYNSYSIYMLFFYLSSIGAIMKNYR